MKAPAKMNYRTLGKTGTKVSALGFGAMRLPTKGKETEVDEAQAIEMIRYAIDQGVNYLDTAYVYHGGNSETVVGKALAGGYREKVHVATKLPIWNVRRSRIATAYSMSSLPDCKPTASISISSTACKRRHGRSCETWAYCNGLKRPDPCRTHRASWFLLPRQLRGIRGDPGRLRLGVLPNPVQLRQ